MTTKVTVAKETASQSRSYQFSIENYMKICERRNTVCTQTDIAKIN
jgi:hypothetical protein